MAISRATQSNSTIEAVALIIESMLPTAQLSPSQSITPSPTVLVVVLRLLIVGAFQSMVRLLAEIQSKQLL